jgi:hypothetical protein
MNLRILKKLSKKAEPVLRGRYGIDCCPSDHGESISTSGKGWPRRQADSRDQFGCYVDMLPNTPIHSYRCSYEYDEWDYRTAWEELVELVGWEYAIYKPDIDPGYVGNGGMYDCFIFPDLSTPAKVFALLKTEPPKSMLDIDP